MTKTSGHSYTKVWIHMIWGTHDHERILNKRARIDLFHHLISASHENGINIEKHNVQPEHVHILFTLPADRTIAQIAKNLKGESSRWINESDLISGKFKWQRGYSAFSVSVSQFETVKKYIDNQDKHHKKKTFSEEYQEWVNIYSTLEE